MRVLKALIVAFALAGVVAAAPIAWAQDKQPTAPTKDTSQQAPQTEQEGGTQKSE